MFPVKPVAPVIPDEPVFPVAPVVPVEPFTPLFTEFEFMDEESVFFLHANTIIINVTNR